MTVSRIVMWCDPEQRNLSREHLREVLGDQGQLLGDPTTNHLTGQVGTLQFRWELHGEFVTYAFFDVGFSGQLADALACTAVEKVDAQWLAKLPGALISAVHIWVVEADAPDLAELSVLLDTGQLMGSSVAEGHAKVYSDFLIKDDGFSRFVVACGPGMTQRRLGRTVMRLFEIEAYRMAALLAVPLAREGASALGRSEQDLARMATVIQHAGTSDEQELLVRLTQLAGEVESLYAQSHTRFTAAAAYFELVDQRIAQLRETRLPGLQTFAEFMERRLTPARNTCAWALHRQEALSLRISRVSDLLRTRVQLEQQISSQALLTSLNKRQDLQLKMQATVEGLSVAAISYYIVGLLGYAAKGAQKWGWPLSSDLTAAMVLPFVVVGVWWSIKRLHRRMGGFD